MEMALTNGFCEMSTEDTQMVSGGFIIAVIAVGAATFTLTSTHVVTAVGAAYAAGKIVGEIQKAFF